MLYPTQEQIDTWNSSDLESYTRSVIDWVVEQVASDFDVRELNGVRGYSPSLPAKLVRNMGRPTAPTLRQLYIRAVNEVASDGPDSEESLSFLRSCLKGRFEDYISCLEDLKQNGDHDSLKTLLTLAPVS